MLEVKHTAGGASPVEMVTIPPMPRRIALLAAFVLAVAAAPSELAEEAPGYHYSTDWTSPNTDAWSRYLGPLAGRADARGLEIGCFEGRSTLWFLEHVLTHPDARMACIDVFTKEIEESFDHNVAVSGQANRVIKYKGYSQDVLRGLPYDSFDFVYIDGCHLASCALSDAILSWDLLRAGGFLIFDDYMFKIDQPPSQRPKLAIDAFLEAFIDQIIVREVGFQVIVEKKSERSAKDLVGKPLVHDPKWLKRLHRLSEQNRRREQRKRAAEGAE